MMRWMICLIALVLAACSGVQKNRSDGYVPAAQQCVTPTDPACVGGATAGVAVPLPTSVGDVKAIFGQCEVLVEGETTPKPCTDIDLVLRGTRENEEATAVVEGYNFKFENLTESTTYKLMTESDRLDVTSPLPQLTPGQPAKISLKAKPKKVLPKRAKKPKKR